MQFASLFFYKMFKLNPSLEIHKHKENYYLKVNSELKLTTNEELLALKIIAENLDPLEIARKFQIKPKIILWFLKRAFDRNLIIKSEPLIKRDPIKFPLKIKEYKNDFLEPEVFNVQWHITNRCDLNCKHCYDRTSRKELSMEKLEKIMEKIFKFCFKYSLWPQITFTGGNPFLHKSFFKLYEKADEMGFTLGILGNPVSEEKLKRIVEIKKPSFYQISLEGLKSYNDFIRGKGHFKKSIDFLKLLKRYGIYSNVMLTLNKKNINEVFDLIPTINSFTDSITFNRLALIGEGKNLEMVDKKEFMNFLHKYVEFAKKNQKIRLKENLINIVLYKEYNEVFGGCTNFGCGAAFNFVAILPDGEVHACRKFHSYIGNVYREDFETIYFSEEAEKYRKPPQECLNCPINRVCRGCLAVTDSLKINFSYFKDPFCFLY